MRQSSSASSQKHNWMQIGNSVSETSHILQFPLTHGTILDGGRLQVGNYTTTVVGGQKYAVESMVLGRNGVARANLVIYRQDVSALPLSSPIISHRTSILSKGIFILPRYAKNWHFSLYEQVRKRYIISVAKFSTYNLLSSTSIHRMTRVGFAVLSYMPKLQWYVWQQYLP